MKKLLAILSILLTTAIVGSESSHVEEIYPDTPLILTLEEIATEEFTPGSLANRQTIFITRASSLQHFTVEIRRKVLQYFSNVTHIRLINLGISQEQAKAFLSHFLALKTAKITEQVEDREYTKLGVAPLENRGRFNWIFMNTDEVERRRHLFNQLEQAQTNDHASQWLEITGRIPSCYPQSASSFKDAPEKQ